MISSPAFGALTAELRRAEANHHDIETLLSRLINARAFGDADDLAAVLHYRVTRATTRPAGSGRAPKMPRLIAGLIPEASGPMSSEMRRALFERRRLIETRANALLETALRDPGSWAATVGAPPTNARTAAIWRHHLLTVAAYRDRYGITSPVPLGAPAQNDAQKIDAARAGAALDRARSLAESHRRDHEPGLRSALAGTPTL